MTLPLSRPSSPPALSIHSRRDQIRTALERCRAGTLALFKGLDRDTFCCHAHPEFSPVGWHLGHIGFTEALWILERTAGYRPEFRQYHKLFAADGLPKTERVYLPEFEEICDYLDTVRAQVLEYLEIAPLETQERLWYWLLQHESQHSETVSLILSLQRGGGVGERRQSEEGRGKRSRNQGDREERFNTHHSAHPMGSPSVYITQHSPYSSPDAMVYIPAGAFQMGNETVSAIDNERPVHWVELESYWIDRYPVTCGQYREFIHAGGYQDSKWWSDAGWAWLQQAQVTQPLYWVDDPVWDEHPVCGISWYEAEAYARFVGKRLPTEAEWEKAASWDAVAQQQRLYPWGNELLVGEERDRSRCNHNHYYGQTTPVTAHPEGQSPYGCFDMLGNVWEWTNSWFDGYDGFEPYLYKGYSQVYFDGQHRVLRGGSWATRSWALRAAFRNWYYPHIRQIFAGFRCAKDEEDGR